ncbi:MAG: hypothetical protein ACRBN8_28815 [Nannocystales bacterium]
MSFSDPPRVFPLRSLPAVGAAAVVLGICGAVFAQEPAGAIDVRWSGPPACGPGAFESDLSALLADSEMSAPLRVDVEVERSEAGWALRADFSSGGDNRGQRVFEAHACETVRDAAALAIALTVDPTALSRPETSPTPAEEPSPTEAEVVEPSSVVPASDSEAAPSSEPAPDIEPVVEPGPSFVSQPAVEPPSVRSAPVWRVGLGALGFVDGAALPGVGGGVSFLVAAMRGPLRLEALGSYRFETDRASEVEPSVGGSFAQWSAGLRALWVPRWSSFEVPVGGGVDAGQTIGEGSGFGEARRTLQPWVAVVGTGGVSWVLHPRVALLARGSLAVPLIRQEFSIEGLGSLHQIGPVQGRGLLGLEVRLR